MASVEIPEGLWAWAEHKGRSQAIRHAPGDVILTALVAARKADISGVPGLGTALHHLDMYASAHCGRSERLELVKAVGQMANLVLPLLPQAEAMGFIEADSTNPDAYRWLGYGA